MSHDTLGLNELLGKAVPMTGQVIVAGGTRVELEGKKGVVHKQSDEAEALSRWQRQEFRELERLVARRWRDALGELDLRSALPSLKQLESVGLRCSTLEEARDRAAKFVRAELNAPDALRLLSLVLHIPPQLQPAIYFRWSQYGLEPLSKYAPYCAHILTVEIFSLVALSCGLISADRPSNRIDIVYLFYLPFCMLFVSSDKLHRRTAPLFLRPDQEFVDGEALKRALREIDARFSQLPPEVLEEGLFKFASTPPLDAGDLVRELWGRHLAPHALDPQPIASDPDRDARLIEEFNAFRRAAESKGDSPRFPAEQSDVVSYERWVSVRKGKWFQLPKGIKTEPEDPRETE